MTRRRSNSARVNLLLSAIFHTVAICGVVFLAAREGMLGSKMKEIAVVIVPKEKPPEPAKEKPPEEPPPAPVEAPKEVAQTAPPPQAAPPPVATASAPPPSAAPLAAPAPAVLPDFSFSDGAKVVQTGTNAAATLYRGFVEFMLRSRWQRPDNVQDHQFVAVAEVTLDPQGIVRNYALKQSSGDERWDASVRDVLASTRSMNRPPPKDFPMKFDIRFDVVADSEPLLSEDSIEVAHP